jgi:pyruvate/2-oxoglutarate/acetoin dehydrogenase E1 component
MRSNSDNAARPKESFAGQINAALDTALAADKNVLVGGQLVRYGVAGLTTGLYEKYPDQFITYSVSESLMNSAAMGLALSGKRPVTIHIRMDFLASGMCALVNHIPVWQKKGVKLPLVMLCQIGKGMGQGPQHSKNLTGWFERFEGWTTRVPQNPTQARDMLLESIFGDKPVMYVVHRELFDLKEGKYIKTPDRITLCGTSRRHEREHYGLDAPSY